MEPALTEGIASLQKPILIPRVLHFLQESNEATLSDMISQGMNRRTADSSLRKMAESGLVDFTKRSAFPEFKKVFRLTPKGLRIVPFLAHLEKELRSCSGGEIGCISELPKGCMPILVHKFNNPNHGISRIIKELRMSPSQINLCLKYLVDRGVLSKEERKAGNRIVSSYSVSDKGCDVAIAAHALDRALKGL